MALRFTQTVYIVILVLAHRVFAIIKYEQICELHFLETRERALQGRKVVWSLRRIMSGRGVSMEVKRDLRNTVIVPTLTYASKTWAWNESQRSRVQAAEMSYLRSACGVNRMDGMSNESIYERFGMCHVGVGKKCGVVEKVTRQMLKWFGHVERMEEGKMTKRVYVSEIEGGNVRGRHPVEWRDRVQEYVRERGEGSLRSLEQARVECQDRERDGSSSAVVIPWWELLGSGVEMN